MNVCKYANMSVESWYMRVVACHRGKVAADGPL